MPFWAEEMRRAGGYGTVGTVTTMAARHTDAVVQYARRLHTSAGARHHVASPLGAWLLLALAGRTATGSARDELTDTLGLDTADAAEFAARLLSEPHPLVLSAAAAWLRPEARSRSADAWLAGLPPAVSRGDVPSQAEADEWANEHTAGLIRRFPLTIGPSTLLILATALATRVSWARPFDVVPATVLGRSSAWAGRLRNVLRTPEGHGHDQFIARTGHAGDVAVQVARARGGLSVVSVAAAPDVPPQDVLAAAHELAVSITVGGTVHRRSLFDLPTGDAQLWSITERPAPTTTEDGRDERCVAVLPAWSATSEHDLGKGELGFAAAADGLTEALALPTGDFQAVQSAVARYHRVGFEAAAVTAMMLRASMPVYREGVLREALLRFGQPYAVVAVADDGARDEFGGSRPGPWHGLPVFSAWVVQPDDTDVDDAGLDDAGLDDTGRRFHRGR